MKITVLSMFPEMFASYQASILVTRAKEKGLLDLEIVDLKEYAKGSYRRMDDSPYGGGAGMLIRCDCILNALDAVRTPCSRVVLFAAGGMPYKQADADRYSTLDHLILIAGHYEGVDARVYEFCDEIISVGDYVLSGGELPAMTVCDSVVRLLDGVLRDESTVTESFRGDLLEYPQYTRPPEYRGMKVPDVLRSGNHAAIEAWRREQAEAWTKKWRPDLYDAYRRKNDT